MSGGICLYVRSKSNRNGKGKKTERELKSIYGCRKCSKSHDLRMLTDLSGNPLWGLQDSGSSIPICSIAFCCLCFCSRIFSLGVSPLVIPLRPVTSFSPKASQLSFSSPIMASFMHRKCRDIAFWASPVYASAAPCPIIVSNEFTIACICSKYLLYLAST